MSDPSFSDASSTAARAISSFVATVLAFVVSFIDKNYRRFKSDSNSQFLNNPFNAGLAVNLQYFGSLK